LSSAVAYAEGPWTAYPDVRIFQSWNSSGYGDFVVPTRIGYGVASGQVETWGFSCNFRDRSINVKKFFKLALDPLYIEFGGFTHSEAKGYYRDYLETLRRHVVSCLGERFPSWEQLRVEWLFSIPSSFQNPSMVQMLNELIGAAGFGQDGHPHSFRITITEAEAAAIDVTSQDMEVRCNRIWSLINVLNPFTEK
jgi:hypothetical protein